MQPSPQSNSGHGHPPERNPVPVSSHSPSPLQPLATTQLYLPLRICPFWTFLINRIIIRGFVCLTSFPEPDVFKVHPCCRVCWTSCEAAIWNTVLVAVHGPSRLSLWGHLSGPRRRGGPKGQSGQGFPAVLSLIPLNSRQSS